MARFLVRPRSKSKSCRKRHDFSRRHDNIETSTSRRPFPWRYFLGKANATYTPPDGDFGSLPPPAAITTYCRPFTAYVAGVALPAKGSMVSHSNAPLDLSKARNFLSKLVAPMNSKPPAVTIGPP